LPQRNKGTKKIKILASSLRGKIKFYLLRLYVTKRFDSFPTKTLCLSVFVALYFYATKEQRH